MLFFQVQQPPVLVDLLNQVMIKSPQATTVAFNTVNNLES